MDYKYKPPPDLLPELARETVSESGRAIEMDGGVKNEMDGDGFEFYRRCTSPKSMILKIVESKLGDLCIFV